MGRSRLGVVIGLAALALANPAGAAEITRLATSGEPGNPFDFHFSLRWDRTQQHSSITRERTDLTANPPFGAIEDVKELSYTRTYNAVVPRVAIGLYKDVELHVEVPYVLADDRAWRGSFTTIESNAITVDGSPCSGSGCALFPVRPTDTTVYHGGRAGDVVVGVAWGVFNDRKDDTKPFWVVGLDVTSPTASLYDPFAGRDPTFLTSPYFVEGKRGPSGEKVWKYDLHTALSRRLGPMDPYFRAHVTGMFHSNDTYSNCQHAAELANPPPGAQAQMTSEGALSCADADADGNGAKLPFVAGLTFGTELVPYENLAEQQKVTFDVRVWADYTSSQRFYNELTDMTGKLHMTEGYMAMGGELGLYLRASKNVGIQARAALSTETSHFLTGEDPGSANYDWRYDAPGRRFRLSGTSLFDLSVAAVLLF